MPVVRSAAFLVVSLALLPSVALAQTRYVRVPAPLPPYIAAPPPIVQPVTPTVTPFAGVPTTAPVGINQAFNPATGTLVPVPSPTLPPPNLGTLAPNATVLIQPSPGTAVPTQPLPPVALESLGVTGQNAQLSYLNAAYGGQAAQATSAVSPTDAATLSALYNSNAASLLTVPSSVVPFSSPPLPQAAEAPTAAPATAPPQTQSAPPPSVVYVVVPPPAAESATAVAAPEAPVTATAAPPAEAPPVEVSPAPPAPAPAPTEAPAPRPRVRPEIVIPRQASEPVAAPSATPASEPAASSRTSSSPPKAPAAPGAAAVLMIAGVALGATLMWLGTRRRFA